VRPTCTEALAHPWFAGTDQHSRATPAEACDAFHHFCQGRRRIKVGVDTTKSAARLDMLQQCSAASCASKRVDSTHRV
jgi:hypothetical protein